MDANQAVALTGLAITLIVTALVLALRTSSLDFLSQVSFEQDFLYWMVPVCLSVFCAAFIAWIWIGQKSKEPTLKTLSWVLLVPAILAALFLVFIPISLTISAKRDCVSSGGIPDIVFDSAGGWETRCDRAAR